MVTRNIEKKNTVLLVDDEPQYLDWLTDYLNAKGYQVITATRLDEAVKLLEQSRYRVVICDLSIPASNQLRQSIRMQQDAYGRYPGAFAAHYARNKGHRSKQVVLYSVHDTNEIQEIADRIGVQYLTKGRPGKFKMEIDKILAYDPKENGQQSHQH